MKKQFVYKLNNRGYLLIEHLITLIITSLLITILLSFIQVTKLYLSNTNQVLLNELEALSTQLQLEAKVALSFSSPTSKTFRIHKRNGEIITYFISDERLMRQVDGKGGEVALYHCKGLNINSIEDHYASIELETSGQGMTLYLHTFNLPLPNTQVVEYEFLEESEESIQETELEREKDSNLDEIIFIPVKDDTQTEGKQKEELNLNDSE